MPANNWIRFTVSIDAVRPSRAGFGKPIIVSSEGAIPEVYQDVSALSELTAFGVSTSDPVYAAMESMIGQAGSRPPIIGIGRRTTAVAQVDTVTIDGTADGTYTHTIVDEAGVSTSFAYVSSSAANEAAIRDGLIALVDADPRYVAAIGSATTYTVTAATAGAPFTSSYGVTGGPAADAITGATTTANNGVFQDLTTIRAANQSFYGITLTDHVDHSIYEGARFTQAQGDSDPMILFGQSNTTAIATNGTSDVGARLNALGRSRVALTYHSLDTQYVDAAIQGRCLPASPGTINWAWQPLGGITTNSLTEAQVSYLKFFNSGGAAGKSVNYCEQLGGIVTFMDGRLSNGMYIETRRGADKLRADVLAELISLYQTADSVPFDEDGIEETANAMKVGAVRLSGGRGEPGLVVRDSIAVTKPNLADVSDTNYANGFIPGITLTARIKTNINEVEGSGTLTVAVTTG